MLSHKKKDSLLSNQENECRALVYYLSNYCLIYYCFNQIIVKSFTLGNSPLPLSRNKPQLSVGFQCHFLRVSRTYLVSPICLPPNRQLLVSFKGFINICGIRLCQKKYLFTNSVCIKISIHTRKVYVSTGEGG